MKQRLQLLQRLIDGTLTDEEKLLVEDNVVIMKNYNQSIKNTKTTEKKTIRRIKNG